MCDVLSDLFFGRVSPFEDITEKTTGTRELFHEYVEKREGFEKDLTEDQRKAVDDLITMRLDLETAYAEEAFRTGFRLAARVAAAAFAPRSETP